MRNIIQIVLFTIFMALLTSCMNIEQRDTVETINNWEKPVWITTIDDGKYYFSYGEETTNQGFIMTDWDAYVNTCGIDTNITGREEFKIRKAFFLKYYAGDTVLQSGQVLTSGYKVVSKKTAKLMASVGSAFTDPVYTNATAFYFVIFKHRYMSSYNGCFIVFASDAIRAQTMASNELGDEYDFKVDKLTPENLKKGVLYQDLYYY